MRSSTRRMPELLQLRRESASTDHGVLRIHDVQAVIQHSLGKTVPFDSRIAVGMVRVQHVTVLDEEQSLYYQGRDFFVLAVGSLWPIEGIEGNAVAVYNIKSRLVFMTVDWVQAAARDERVEWRGACLRLHVEPG